MPIRTLLLALGLSFLAGATAQSLIPLAPDTTVLVLETAPDAGVPAGLVAALTELGWDEALDTLGRLVAALGAGTDDVGLDGMAMPDWDGLLADLEAECGPGTFDVAGLEVRDLVVDGLLAVSSSPFAPVPQVVALARPGDAARAGALQDALVDCFGDLRLEQDGVALHVLMDGSDLPLIVGRVDGVFFVATDPNLARGVVRRALGSAEPSMVGTSLGAAMEGLAPGGFGFGIDLGALGAVGGALAGTLPPDVAPLLERAVAAIQTVGVVAGRVGWAADGLRFEQVQAGPAPAPDAALGRLLTDPRPAERPLWLPAGAVSVSSSVVPLRAAIDYLDGWLAALEGPLGMRFDVRGLASEHLDLDLDAALLAWIGETVHVIELEALGTDLRGWVQGAPRIVAIPVLHEGLARDGIDALGAGLLRVLSALGGLGDQPFADPFGDPFAEPFADPFAPRGGAADLDAFFGPDAIVVTRELVDGFEVDRVRVGPTLDMAVTLVDGHLVLASPYRALRPLLATRSAGPRLGDDPTWGAAIDALPDGARAVGIVDLAAYLRGLAELGELGAQPLASALVLAMTVGISDIMGGPSDPFEDVDFGGFGAFDDDTLTFPAFGDLPWHVDVDELPVVPLAVGGTVDDAFVANEFARRYELTELTAGTVVEVEMATDEWSLDTYLYVFDANGNVLLFENDDAPGTDRSFVAFEVEAGVAYHVLATSWGGDHTGAYVLRVRERGAAPADEATGAPAPSEEPFVDTEREPIDAPTFAELLRATDLLPRALHLIADRSGLAVTTTTVEGDRVVTRFHWPIR
jgi:hypothetical protein